STVRRLCLPAVAPLYAGYVAWRALIPENALPAAIHRDMFEAMTFCLPPGERGERASAAAHRREWRQARDLDSAAADPRRRHRRHARGGGAAIGAAIARHRAADRGADIAADLRPGEPASCIR